MTPAQAYTFLYSGAGYVYVTGLSGTFPAPAYEFGPYAFPSTGYPNVPFNRTVIESWGRTSVPDNADSYATFSINITTAVASNCTAVTVGGVNQVATFAMVAGNAAASAQAMASAINSFVSVAPDYSAIAVGTMVIGRCNVAGSTPNGGAVSLTFSAPGNVYTTTPVAGGRTTGQSAVRIWLDIDPMATETAPTANKVEITDWVHHQGLESPAVVVGATVASNILTVPRKASLMRVNVSGPSALRTLNLEGAVAGDEVELVGVTGFPCDVESGAGNIVTSNSATVPLTGPSTRISLIYSTSGGGTWNESTRSETTSLEDLRALGVATPLQPGVFQLNAAAGTATITPGTTGGSAFPGVVREHNIVLTAGAALGAAMNFSVDAILALRGDTGTISGNGQAVTGDVITFSDNTGLKATLSTELAASGLWTAIWTANDVGGAASVSFNIVPEFSVANTQFIDPSWLIDASIADAKIIDLDGAKLTTGTVPESALDGVAQAKLNANGILSTTVSVLTAAVLTLNSVPVVAVPAQGPGTVIVPLMALSKIAYNSAPYATNTDLILIHDTSATPAMIDADCLLKTVNAITQSVPVTSGLAAATQMMENKDLLLTVAVGDPTAGDSDLTVLIHYVVVSV